MQPTSEYHHHRYQPAFVQVHDIRRFILVAAIVIVDFMDIETWPKRNDKLFERGGY